MIAAVNIFAVRFMTPPPVPCDLHASTLSAHWSAYGYGFVCAPCGDERPRPGVSGQGRSVRPSAEQRVDRVGEPYEEHPQDEPQCYAPHSRDPSGLIRTPAMTTLCPRSMARAALIRS